MRNALSICLGVAVLCVVASQPGAAQRPLLPHPAVLANASAELIDRLRADPFTYFRFVNRAWTQRVCEAFADVTNPPIVRLHGDAHVEQFAITKSGWGLGDFDDSARGPSFIDIVRFLGSIDLAARQRGWTQHRDRLWTSFFTGYRLGMSDPNVRTPEPDIVRELRRRAPMTRAGYLAWGERLMEPIDAARAKAIVSGMERFEELIRRERPDLPAGYFGVRRAGWLRLGIGSATVMKVLIRVEGPTSDPDDDVLIEGKETVNLDGVSCLEAQTASPAIRIIAGAQQLGRLKHDILAVAPTVLLPSAADRAERWLDWWLASWEPTYREIRIADLRSVTDLGDIAFDAGVQLGAGKVVAIRSRELASSAALEQRLRTETAAIVEELLAGWRVLAKG